MCTDDDKDHNPLMQGCENIKLNIHVKDNRNGFTNLVLATSGLDFNLSLEWEKPNDTKMSITKCLMQKNSNMGSDMSVPYAVLHPDRSFWF